MNPLNFSPETRRLSKTESNQLSKDEKLLSVYEGLRAEVRMRIRVNNRRATRGVAILAAIAGSALVQTNYYVLALLPLVLGILFIDSVRSFNELVIIARHMVEIERELSSEEHSPVQYELMRGGIYGRKREVDGTYLRDGIYVANRVRVVLFILVYLLSVAISLEYWPSPLQFFGFEINRQILSIIITLFTFLLATVTVSHYLYKNRLIDEVRSDAD